MKKKLVHLVAIIVLIVIASSCKPQSPVISFTKLKDILINEQQNTIERSHVPSALNVINDSTAIMQNGDFEIVKLNTKNGNIQVFSLSDSFVHAMRIKYGISDTMYNVDTSFPKYVIYSLGYTLDKVYIQCGISYLRESYVNGTRVHSNSHLSVCILLDNSLHVQETILFPREEGDRFGMAIQTQSLPFAVKNDTLLLSNSSTSKDSMRHLIRKYIVQNGKYRFIGYGRDAEEPDYRDVRGVYFTEPCFSSFGDKLYYIDRSSIYELQTGHKEKLVTEPNYVLLNAWHYDAEHALFLTFYKGEKVNPDTTIDLKCYYKGTVTPIAPVAKLKDLYVCRLKDNIYHQVVRVGDNIHYQEYKIEVHEK